MGYAFVVSADGHDGPRSIRVCGDDLLSVSYRDSFQCQQVADQLRQAGGWLEAVGGIDSVLVRFDAATTDLDAAFARLEAQLRSVTMSADASPERVEVPVCYGGEFGPDLDVVCEMLDLTPAELIELHTRGEYRVEMIGFTPGFAYVGGLPGALNVPRLERPRQHVAAGSIGIADGRSGLYAMPGPGGWRIIGRTPLRLFDKAAKQPFLLGAGMRVRFYSIGADQFRSPEAT